MTQIGLNHNVLYVCGGKIYIYIYYLTSCPNRTLAIYVEIHGKSCSCEYIAQVDFPRDKEKNILNEFPLLKTA